MPCRLSSAFVLRLCSIGILFTVLGNLLGLPSWQQHQQQQQPNIQRRITSFHLTQQASRSHGSLLDAENVDRLNLLLSHANSSNNHDKNQHQVVSGDKSQDAVLDRMVQRDLENPHKHFSACLLIRDDNQLLNEWIAYHYHTLKLRDLLVAVDPDSQTSPHNILHRWQDLTDLEVLEWSDVDYMPERFLKDGFVVPLHRINGNASQSKYHEGHEDENQVKRDLQRINSHRFRQLTFLSSCFRHLREIRKTWVLHIDTDEYLTINPVLRGKRQLGQHLTVPKDLRDPNTLLKFLTAIRYRPRLNKMSNFPCISLPRLMFGSLTAGQGVEESTIRVLQSSSFQPAKFETLRWKYHTSYVDRERNALPKVLVDVSVVSETDEMFKRKAFSIHRPSKKLCRTVDQMNFNKTEAFPLSVNHYLGSWDRYISRKNDTRRSRSAYEAKAFVKDGRDDWIISWIDGFLDNMDPSIARKLLQDYL